MQDRHEKGRATHRLTQPQVPQPTSAFATRFLEADPLLFFPALAQSWGQQSTQLRLQDGLLTRQYDGRVYHLITAQIAFNPFDASGQTRFLDQWAHWSDTLRQNHPGLELTYTSFARFAATTRRSIRRDIELISLLSVIGVVLLTVSIFRTLTHLLLALIPLAAGIWSAIGLTLYWFGELHGLTLAFGASLIGICIDYSFHYFAHHRLTAPWHATQAMRQILPALSLGALTTTLSYLALALTPLVGLQQIAVFASCGIFVSFGTVVLWFPAFLRRPHPQAHRFPPLYRGAQWLFALWHRRRAPVVAPGALLTLICLSGLWSLRIDDSPRALNALPPDLAAQDHRIRTIMGTPAHHSYLIVEGPTAEAALQRLEPFHAVLQVQSASPFVRLGPVLTQFLPPAAGTRMRRW